MAEKCRGICKSGSPCKSAVLPGRPFCLFHDPEAAALRQAGSAKGGRNRANVQRAKAQIPDALTPGQLAGWLSLLFKRTIAGQTEPKIAHAAAAVARVLFDVRTAVAVEDLQEQLDALKALVGRERAA